MEVMKEADKAITEEKASSEIKKPVIGVVDLFANSDNEDG